MWSETIPHRDYRHPYLPEFFRQVAEAVPLTGKEDLLDLGCGVGEVAFGLAPFVGSLTGMDLELPMLEEAEKRAREAGHTIRLVHAKVEDAPADLGRFHLISIGRAHWFMHTPKTLARLDQWLLPRGHILVCMPVQNPDNAKWHRVYTLTQRKWGKGDHFALMNLTFEQFFQGTDFVPATKIHVRGQRRLDLDHLIQRTLGTPSTTPAMLGADTDRMLADLRQTMAPYFRNGPILENHLTVGLLYRRRQDWAELRPASPAATPAPRVPSRRAAHR